MDVFIPMISFENLLSCHLCMILSEPTMVISYGNLVHLYMAINSRTNVYCDDWGFF